mgnify:CR=1 FL=1
MSQEIKFYRGVKSNYSEELHKDCIYFATDKREIILNGQSYGCEIDDELLNNSTNPATGRSIYKAIQDMVSSALQETAIGSKLMLVKYGNVYKIELYDSRTNTLLSQTENGFIGGEGTADMSGLSIQQLHGDLYVRSGHTAQVKFKYDVLNSNGYSTGTEGRAVIQIINTANNLTIDTIEKELIAGEISITDITKYLIEGSSITVKVKVSAETNKGEQIEEFSCKAFLINLKLLERDGFSIARAYKKGDTVEIPFDIEGSSTIQKTVTCYLNGKAVEETNVFSGGTFKISTSSLSHGTHAFQIRAAYRVDEITTIYSNSIYFGLVIYEEGNARPIVASRFEYEDGSLITGIPYIDIEQYDSYSLPYAVMTPRMLWLKLISTQEMIL